MTTRDSISAVTSGLRVDSSASANNRPTWRNLVLRGGRVTKYKGVAGGVSPLAIGALTMALATGGQAISSVPAFAGECTPGSASECSGAANPGADSTQSFSGGPVSVVTVPGFGLDVASGNAISANTTGGFSFVDANSSSITGQNYGMEIINAGSGDLLVNSTGRIEGTAWDAISAENLLGTGALTIEAKDLEAGRRGVEARQSGTGALTVNVSGTINSGWDGIVAETESQTVGDITINVNEINAQGMGGNSSGIYVLNRGTGNTEISATGTVSSLDGAGIYYIGTSQAGNLSVDVVDVSGGQRGIYVQAAGAGAVDIDVTGTATGVAWDGIRVDTAPGTKRVTLDVNNAIGGNNGITVIHAADSSADDNDVAITVTGRIQGGADGWGIWTQSNPGVVSNITVKGTATVGSAGGRAIINDDGFSYITVEDARTVVDNPDTPEVETSSVNGLVWLQGGNDNLDLNGGFSGITVLDGGSGTDRLQLFNAADAVYAGADIRNWDVFRLSNSRVKITGSSLAVGTPGDATTGIFLTNGSVFDLSGEPVFNLDSNLTLAAGTTYLGSGDGRGDNTIYGDVNNAGLMSLAGTGAGDTLTIRQDYAGNGGTVEIDTVLGDDSSQTDQLRILGNTSGTSNVRVNNLGGAGAPTVEGIKIIDVVGASDGEFSLVGDYEIGGKQAVVTGAFGYTLWKNGISTPGDGDWYLRSWDDGGPIYQPGAAIYESYAQALLGMNGLPTLQQRVGNRYWSDAPTPKDASSSEAGLVNNTGVWGVIEGSYGEFQPDSSTTGAEYDQDIWKMRFGFDGLISETESGKLIGGIMANFGRGSTDISSKFGSGDISSDAYGAGVTATWYGNSGLYLDGQAQATWFDSDLSSDWVGELASGNNGWGYALSMEAGQRVDAGKDWTLIPQAQLVYSNVRFDEFTDPFGAEVEKDQADSLRARFGLAAEREASWADEQGEIVRAAFYGIANLNYELLDGTSVNVAGTQIESQNDRAWGEIGAGGTYSWNDDSYALYGELSTSSSLQNFADSYTVKGTAGLRINW